MIVSQKAEKYPCSSFRRKSLDRLGTLSPSISLGTLRVSKGLSNGPESSVFKLKQERTWTPFSNGVTVFCLYWNLFTSLRILTDQGFSWSCPLPSRTQSLAGYFFSFLDTMADAKKLRYLYRRSEGVSSRRIISVSLSSGTKARSVRT